MNSDTTHIGGYSKTVGADAEVFLDEEQKPVAVSEESPLPVAVLSGFRLPAHNDLEVSYTEIAGGNKPTYMTFRLNGTEVFWLVLSYDSAGNLLRIQPD